MKYLFLLALRTIKENKWRSLVNIAVIAFSVAMVVIPSTFFATLTETQKYYVLSSLPADMPGTEVNQILSQDWGIKLFQGIGMFLSGLMLTVAAFMIYGAYSAGIRERAKLMAVLTTVGADDWQKSFVMITESLILSVIGIPCGMLIGLPTVYVALLYIKPIFADKSLVLHFSIDHQTVLRAALIGIAVMLISTLIALIKTLRRSIIGLAKSTSDIEIRLKKSPLDWIMWKLFGKSGELALANYVNQKRNYRFLSLSFAIAMTLYVNFNLLIPYFQQNTRPAQSSIENFKLLANSITFVLNAVVILSVINCVIMIGTMFHSRKREFARYQSIGMSMGTMYQIVILEWIFRGFYLFVYGLFGTYAVNILLYGIMQNLADAIYFINPVESLLHALIAVVILTVMMTVAMITKLHRISIVETIKAVN